MKVQEGSGSELSRVEEVTRLMTKEGAKGIKLILSKGTVDSDRILLMSRVCVLLPGVNGCVTIVVAYSYMAYAYTPPHPLLSLIYLVNNDAS